MRERANFTDEELDIYAQEYMAFLSRFRRLHDTQQGNPKSGQETERSKKAMEGTRHDGGDIQQPSK